MLFSYKMLSTVYILLTGIYCDASSRLFGNNPIVAVVVCCESGRQPDVCVADGKLRH